ncbi:MAG TPA: aspartate/glutamate racemase family protein [Roseiflexaceae bacterium]|nr:aspartate/glutamate racemase family protein [Roseiflexaceae bacterium]
MYPAKMKTIGVIGGLGPQATMDFEARVHAVSQRFIPPFKSGGYPPMVVYYHRRPPFAVDDQLRPAQPLQADRRLLEAARRLGGWADLLVISANAPHLVKDQIAEAFGGTVLSMIDVTLGEVQRRQLQRVGVVGLGTPQVYLTPLEERGLAAYAPPAELQGPLDAAIFALMEGRADGAGRGAARAAVAQLRARQPEAIILGCTEVPLLLGQEAEAPDLINPVQLLAETVVRLAISNASERV